MKSVGCQADTRSAQHLKIRDEDIVYSMIERHSGKASQPNTTRSITVTSLIVDTIKRTLARLGFFFNNNFHTIL